MLASSVASSIPKWPDSHSCDVLHCSPSAGALLATVDYEIDVPTSLGFIGPTRSCCWVGRAAETYATGHERGDILLWSLPNPRRPEGALIARLRLRADTALCLPVRSLHFVAGEADALLVFGGQGAEMPDSLTLVELPEAPPVRRWRE